MTRAAISDRISRVTGASAEFDRFMSQSSYATCGVPPGGYDLIFGNPHERALPGLVEALQRWSAPQTDGWFGYALNRAASRRIIAAALRRSHGMPFEPDDIFVTNGGFAAISVALATVVNPGDEVIYISPHWFFYEALIVASGARPVSVPVLENFDLDLHAIAAAISPRTRAIIVNSPNNPTGVIYPPATLAGLAELLREASARIGQTIYLVSDEAYSRIVFDGQPFHSPLRFYPHAFLAYTYGKTLLTPGQRIGYVALPPTMPDREPLRAAIDAAQLVTGFAYPNALLQHALPDLEQLSIDVAQLQRRRDRLVTALRTMGYHVQPPAGTFYLFPRAPWPDDWAFVELLAQHNVFCLPGIVVGRAGHFRISLTANDAMIEGALPGFAAALHEAAPGVAQDELVPQPA